MTRVTNRPLSPHLTIWKWGPAMLVSILHRATGAALAIGGGIVLVWWLMALAGGPEAYANFLYYMVQAAPGDTWGNAANILALLVLIGLTWAFFQHMFSGLRHFVMDLGAGYELKTNKSVAIFIPFASVIVTAAMWMFIFMRQI